MRGKKWREKLAELVRELFLSREMGQFYSMKITPERAKLYILQLGIYVRQRRNYWPQVAANCPEFDVKQRILAHEYEELVEDEHSAVGHLDLVMRQGREVEKHSEMFLDVLERYVPPGSEKGVLETAKESMDIHRAYFGGMAMAMGMISNR
jgi:hypothetical protein